MVRRLVFSAIAGIPTKYKYTHCKVILKIKYYYFDLDVPRSPSPSLFNSTTYFLFILPLNFKSLYQFLIIIFIHYIVKEKATFVNRPYVLCVCVCVCVCACLISKNIYFVFLFFCFFISLNFILFVAC